MTEFSIDQIGREMRWGVSITIREVFFDLFPVYRVGIVDDNAVGDGRQMKKHNEYIEFLRDSNMLQIQFHPTGWQSFSNFVYYMYKKCTKMY